MRKLFVLLLSILTSMALISGGYGVWTEQIEIEGDLKVIPDPEVISSMEAEISSLESILNSLEKQLEEEIGKQRAYEEQQRLLAEKQADIELQKLLEQQNIQGENSAGEYVEGTVESETQDDFTLATEVEENQEENEKTVVEDTHSIEDNKENTNNEENCVEDAVETKKLEDKNISVDDVNDSNE